MSVVVETTVGDFTIDLFTSERPRTCQNFLKLCKVKYYNFCLFHSIQSNFIAQTGDPSGTGNEGESIFGIVNGSEFKYYPGETIPKMKHDVPGLISMVNCGENMIGSQFFITLSDKLDSLDEHVIFGQIAEGREILLKLNETICDIQHRPYQDIRITHTVILEDPFDDIPGMIIPDRSPEPTEETFANSRIRADEDIDDTAGCTAREIEERKADREAKARATILEIIGDIPDKDIAPPENVLFVCKLNPVTTDEDLDIIFSRFGEIKSCEVIRDKVTGDSLQYAFIEFADRKSCEEAYLKMDNVLIDDRRIHVDFSQSVAKIRWKGKGRGVEYLSQDQNTEEFKHDGNKKDYEKLSRKEGTKSTYPDRKMSQRADYDRRPNSKYHKDHYKSNDSRRKEYKRDRNESKRRCSYTDTEDEYEEKKHKHKKTHHNRRHKKENVRENKHKKHHRHRSRS